MDETICVILQLLFDFALEVWFSIYATLLLPSLGNVTEYVNHWWFDDLKT